MFILVQIEEPNAILDGCKSKIELFLTNEMIDQFRSEVYMAIMII